MKPEVMHMKKYVVIIYAGTWFYFRSYRMAKAMKFYKMLEAKS